MLAIARHILPLSNWRRDARDDDPITDPRLYVFTRPAPACMIGQGGVYNAGLFEDFQGEVNLRDARRGAGVPRADLRVAFDSASHFVSCRMTISGRSCETAITVHDKERGSVEQTSLRSKLDRNQLRANDSFTGFCDPDSVSFIRLMPDGSVELSVEAEWLRFAATARPVDNAPLVRIMRQSGGHGVLQRHHNLELTMGRVIIEGRERMLDPGAVGWYEQNVGHRPRRHSQRDLRAAGEAVHVATGRKVRLGLHVVRHQAHDELPEETSSANVWIDGVSHRLLGSSIERDPAGAWRVNGGLELVLEPLIRERSRLGSWFGRREERADDFGRLAGEIELDGERYRLDGLFAAVSELQGAA